MFCCNLCRSRKTKFFVKFLIRLAEATIKTSTTATTAIAATAGTAVPAITAKATSAVAATMTGRALTASKAVIVWSTLTLDCKYFLVSMQ